MHLNKQQRYERTQARLQGRAAFRNGLTLADNPYEFGTDCNGQWDVGFEEEANQVEVTSN
jgi:hypothetical protein